MKVPLNIKMSRYIDIYYNGESPSHFLHGIYIVVYIYTGFFNTFFEEYGIEKEYWKDSNISTLQDKISYLERNTHWRKVVLEGRPVMMYRTHKHELDYFQELQQTFQKYYDSLKM